MTPRNSNLFIPVSVKIKIRIKSVKTICISAAIILLIKVEYCKSTSSNSNCENCTLIPTYEYHANNIDIDVGVGGQSKHAEFRNATTTKSKQDQVFKLDSAIFEKFMKNFDWSIIPGYRPEDDLDNWIVPDVIKQNCPPVYISGFDRLNQPIWVMHYGKFNFRKFAVGGPELENLFHTYIRYTVNAALKSRALRSTDENPVKQLIYIIDFEGVTPESLLDLQVLRLQLKMMSNYRRYGEKYLNKVILLNVNLVSENLLNLGRFFLLRLVDKFVIYGTNKSWWVPQLLKTLPKESLPDRFGGAKGFKPLYYVY